MTRKQTKNLKKLQRIARKERVNTLRAAALKEIALAWTATNPVAAANHMNRAASAMGNVHNLGF